MKTFLRMFLLLVLAFGTAACGPNALAALDQVARYVEDAGRLLDWVRSVSSIYFLAHPNPAKQAEVERLVAAASLAADAYVRADRAAGDAKAGNAAAAKADFAKAWGDIERELGELGIVGAPGTFGRPAIPRPLLLDG